MPRPKKSESDKLIQVTTLVTPRTLARLKRIAVQSDRKLSAVVREHLETAPPASSK